MLLFLCLISAITGQFLATWTWQTPGNCYQIPTERRIVGSACTVAPASACTCYATNVAGTYNCSITQCFAAYPTNQQLPSTSNQSDVNAVFKQTFLYATYSSINCASAAQQSTAYSNNKCIQDPGQLTSYKLYCRKSASGSYYYGYYYYYIPGAIVTHFYSDTFCKNGKGINPRIEYTGCTNALNATLSGYGSIIISCKPTCFHADSQITYKGKNFPIKSIPSDVGCVVPHVVTSSGVKITTSCQEKPLRVTLEHLVYTQNGLVAAESVKIGDTLFSDQAQQLACVVAAVELESGEYYGLNCEDSDVLADGYKTSTFGHYHSLPAFWMKWASKVIGVSSASYYGDAIANLFYTVFPH